MSSSIKRVGTEDLDSLCDIERRCFNREAYTKEEIFTMLKNRSFIGFVVKINGKTVAFILGAIENYGVKIGHVYTVDVLPEYRRAGIGQKMLNEIEQDFLRKGAATVHLEVRADNKAALELYSKQGYISLKTVQNYYSSGITAIQLRKKLTG